MLGRIQPNHGRGKVRAGQLVQQIGNDPECRIVQCQAIEFGDLPVQAATHLSHDGETGIGRLPQYAFIGCGIDAPDLAPEQSRGRHRVHRPAGKHDCLGKGDARCNEVDDLLVPLGGYQCQLDLSAVQQEDFLRRLPLLEQDIILVQ